MAYFPMYIDIADQDCLIVGGGTIAYRKALVLLDFGAKVSVVATVVSDELKRLPVAVFEQAFELEQLNGKELVVCATDNSALNLAISAHCKENRIPVNVVDQAAASSFIFPSYVKENDLVAAISSGGKSPLLTQILKKIVSEQLTPFLGELNEYLGSCRATVQSNTDSEAQRKHIYQSLYELAISQNRLPSQDELAEIISHEL